MKSKLAILGGKPLIKEKLRPYNSISEKEKMAVMKVVDSNCLSGFYGSWRNGFLVAHEFRI